MRIILTILITAVVVLGAYEKYDEFQRKKLESAIATTPVPSAPVDVPSVPEPSVPEPPTPDKPPGTEPDSSERNPVVPVESAIEERLNSLDAKLTELLSKSESVGVGTTYDDAKLMEKVKTLECYLGELIYWKRGETPVRQSTSGSVLNRAVVPTYAGYSGYSGGYSGTCTNGSCFRGGGYP